MEEILKWRKLKYIGGDITPLNHTYTFDTSNRISTEKVIADSGDIVIRTYTYF